MPALGAGLGHVGRCDDESGTRHVGFDQERQPHPALRACFASGEISQRPIRKRLKPRDLKDGARSRVRTLDPFRVKEVLYH